MDQAGYLVTRKASSVENSNRFTVQPASPDSPVMGSTTMRASGTAHAAIVRPPAASSAMYPTSMVSPGYGSALKPIRSWGGPSSASRIVALAVSTGRAEMHSHRH